MAYTTARADVVFQFGSGAYALPTIPKKDEAAIRYFHGFLVVN